MPQKQYLSTDPNEGTPLSEDSGPRLPKTYVSTDPNAGEPLSDEQFAAYAEGDQLVANVKNIGRVVGDVATGVVKGVGQTASNLGRLVHKIPGVSTAVDTLYGTPGLSDQAFGEADKVLAPSNTAQRVGKTGEQMSEFLIPAGAAERATVAVGTKVASKLPKFVLRSAGQGAASGGVAAVHREDPSMAAFLGAAAPAAGAAVSEVGERIGAKAVPLVRSALKPTVAEMRRIAGASQTGIQAQADRLARFIIDNRLTSSTKAQAIIDDAEQSLQTAIQSANATTDAPQRAARYLHALERSAAKQGLPADDVATIRAKAAELLESSPLSETVQQTVMKPSVTLDASGKPFLVPTKVDVRSLRSDVPADEALDLARSSSRWSTRKSWGEQKGAATEADKAVERAARDAVKDAVPEARPILQRQSQAITAKKVLDRQAFREANRDQIGLPTYVTAAGEMAAGRIPKLAMAAQFLRDNQLRLGVWADRLSKAIERKDVAEASDILARFGVGATTESLNPAYAGP